MSLQAGLNIPDYRAGLKVFERLPENSGAVKACLSFPDYRAAGLRSVP